MKQIEVLIQQVIADLWQQSVDLELTPTKPEFGDLATNVAMRLAGQIGAQPREVAEQIVARLADQPLIADASVAGPGFINLRLSDQAIAEAWASKIDLIYQDQVVVCEFSDPNPFKVLHAGHLYTSVVGEAIAILVEATGGKVYRLNFGGDVGLHVGKTMWAILQALGGEQPGELAKVPVADRSDWLAARYVEGSQAFEDDAAAEAEIRQLNQRVYQIHQQDDHQSNLAQIYWQTRDWSYDYFKAFYQRIGVKFDRFYPESAVAERGLAEVQAQIGQTFTESDGAVVFEGEKFGLHTRVFINKQGLPTYEAKDVGLAFTKYDDYHYDKSIIITADEQKQYMEVVLKALEQFAPQVSETTTHITHGMVKLAGGEKMSSRKGNFLRAVDVLDVASQAQAEQNSQANEAVSLGAVKYSFLKVRVGGNLIYDPEESVSLAGNSGPYLQYAHARACSVLAKLSEESDLADQLRFDPDERNLALKLIGFNAAIETAAREFLPHVVCNYLYELAQEFNRFYEQSPIIGSDRQAIRTQLVRRYRQTLADGLKILGIKPLEKM